jgi:hypothetical protein
MIGLSLSLCVADIINGEVPIDEVRYIIAGTCVRTAADLDDVIACYRETYWRNDPDGGERIVRQLFAEGKVDQPRLGGLVVPSIHAGHWRL